MSGENKKRVRLPAHQKYFLHVLWPSRAADKCPPLFTLSLSIIVYKAATICQVWIMKFCFPSSCLFCRGRLVYFPDSQADFWEVMLAGTSLLNPIPLAFCRLSRYYFLPEKRTVWLKAAVFKTFWGGTAHGHRRWQSWAEPHSARHYWSPGVSQYYPALLAGWWDVKAAVSAVCKDSPAMPFVSFPF